MLCKSSVGQLNTLLFDFNMHLIYFREHMKDMERNRKGMKTTPFQDTNSMCTVKNDCDLNSKRLKMLR